MVNKFKCDKCGYVTHSRNIKKCTCEKCGHRTANRLYQSSSSEQPAPVAFVTPQATGADTQPKKPKAIKKPEEPPKTDDKPEETAEITLSKDDLIPAQEPEIKKQFSCPICGEAISEDQPICESCGSELEWE